MFSEPLKAKGYRANCSLKTKQSWKEKKFVVSFNRNKNELS